MTFTLDSLSKHEIDLIDTFAGQTMQALITGAGDGGDCEYVEEVVALNAYKMAVAMLAERKKLTSKT